MPKPNKRLKQKTCWNCKGLFTPWISSLQDTCSVPCAIKKAEHQRDKLAERKTKADQKAKRKDLRERKEKLKSKSKWLAEAQIPFNKFIRLRDAHEPCISCGRYDHEIEYRGVGGKFDCGHWKTRGAYPELRFTELNCHKQCKSCNGGAGNFTSKNHTVTQQYTENLIKKIGIVQFEWLNAKHEPLNLTIPEIKAIKLKYQKKAKEIE
jgi:hypothetical protein